MEKKDGLSKWVWKCPLHNIFWVKDGTRYKVKYAQDQLLTGKVQESMHHVYFDQKNRVAVITYGEKHTDPEELGFTVVEKPCTAQGKKPLSKFKCLRHGRSHMKKIHNNSSRTDPPCVRVEAD